MIQVGDWVRDGSRGRQIGVVTDRASGQATVAVLWRDGSTEWAKPDTLWVVATPIAPQRHATFARYERLVRDKTLRVHDGQLGCVTRIVSDGPQPTIHVNSFGGGFWSGNAEMFDRQWDILQFPAVGDPFGDSGGRIGVVALPDPTVTLNIAHERAVVAIEWSGSIYGYSTYTEFFRNWTKVEQTEPKSAKLKNFEPLW